MFRHVVIWQCKEELSDAEKRSVKEQIKERLEAFNGNVDGLVEIRVYIDPAPTSNAEVLLDSSFDDAAAAAYYNDLPAHVAVKEELIFPNLTNRLCMDYEV